MARVYLPYAEWPKPDQIAWETAIREGDILDGCGPAAHWRPATRQTNIRHYSRWLGHRAEIGELDPNVSASARVTPERVRVYVNDLKRRVAPRTVVSSMVGLKVMIKAMAPEQSWGWLNDLCNALNRTSRPITDKRSRMRDTGEIIRLALAELDRLGEGPLVTRLDRVAFRDTLMLALMAARPLRLKNFAGLIIGLHLRYIADHWVIDIPADETKTNQPLTFDVPAFLVPYLNLYLDRVRPTFLRPESEESDHLWLEYKGAPLTYHGLYCRIVHVTKRLIGHSINPHLLRDCAATTLSTRSVDEALTAAALLGHRSFKTTEKHYIRANQLQASRQVAAVLDDIRTDTKEAS